jgi:hypothetical protein
MVKLVYKLKDGKYATDDGETTDLQEAEDFSDYEYPNTFTPIEAGKLVWCEAADWEETEDWAE